MKDILFPSPYGEVGFDPTKEGEIQNEEILRFRPLTGKLVLITFVSSTSTNFMRTFPSPYGEVGFDLALQAMTKT